MPHIGTVTFLFLSGEPVSKGMVLQELSRPGIDGHAFRRVGTRGKPYVMRGILAGSSAANVREKLRELESQRGTLVNVEDDHQTEFTAQLLLECQGAPCTRVGGAIGAFGVNHLLELEAVLLDP